MPLRVKRYIYSNTLSFLAAWATMLGGVETTQAGIVQIGSAVTASGSNPATGKSVSASVSFFYNDSDKNTLIIDLVNTPSGGTLQAADVLTGLVFDISGSPGYSTAPSKHNLSPSLTLSGLGSTSTQLGTGNFTESWTNLFTSGGNPNVTGGYGFSTSGFNGAFNGNGLTAEDNGIVGPGTILSNDGLSSHTPLAMTGLEFSLSFNSDISAATFSNIQFLFGTAGTGILTPNTPAVPEPTSIALVSTGLVGFLLIRRQKRRRA